MLWALLVCVATARSAFRGSSAPLNLPRQRSLEELPDARPSSEKVLTDNEGENRMLAWQQERLQKYADEHNVVLIVRTPEKESVQRMMEMFEPFYDSANKKFVPVDEEGGKCVPSKVRIQCKGLDVHSKSSNWGPMSGFVTVDPFFSKGVESVAGPKAAIMTASRREDIAIHIRKDDEMKIGKETGWGVIQLQIPKGVVPDDMKACDTNGPCGSGTCLTPKATTGKKAGVKFCVKDASGSPGMGLVSWVDKQTNGLVPLYVFSYSTRFPATLTATTRGSHDTPLIGVGGDPVTGDFDLWLVAYHVSSDVIVPPSGGTPRLDRILRTRKHALRGDYGIASEVEAQLVNGSPFDLNKAVMGTTDGPCQVFLHPSEMFNEDFTQPIPDMFIFVVPSYFTLRVRDQVIRTGVTKLPKLSSGAPDISFMGDVLAELVDAHYVFPINPTYMAVEHVFRTRSPMAGGRKAGEIRGLLRMIQEAVIDPIIDRALELGSAEDKLTRSWGEFVDAMVTHARERFEDPVIVSGSETSTEALAFTDAKRCWKKFLRKFCKASEEPPEWCPGLLQKRKKKKQKADMD